MMELGNLVDGMLNNLVKNLIHSRGRHQFVDIYLFLFFTLFDMPINNIVIFYYYIVFF